MSYMHRPTSFAYAIPSSEETDLLPGQAARYNAYKHTDSWVEMSSYPYANAHILR